MSEKVNYSDLITVIITTYNRFESTKKAVHSVIKQTYTPVEIIVVEDGTDSGIETWLKENNLNQIKYIKHDKNKGLSASRNTGWKNAKGNYIAFLDDDDIWKPEKLSKQMEYLYSFDSEKLNKLGVLYCGNEIHYSDGRICKRTSFTNIGNLKNCIIKYGANTVPSACIFPRKVLEDVSGYDENLVSSVDHDMWMKLAVAGYDADVLNDPLVICKAPVVGKTMMTSVEPRIKGLKQYVEKWLPVYREWFGRKNGNAYGEKYFAWVISMLASERIVNGDLCGGFKAVKEIFSFSKQYLYNIYIISKLVIKKILSVKIPINIKNIIHSFIKSR